MADFDWKKYWEFYKNNKENPIVDTGGIGNPQGASSASQYNLLLNDNGITNALLQASGATKINKYVKEYTKQAGKDLADLQKEYALNEQQYAYDLDKIVQQAGADIAVQQQQQLYDLFADSTQLQRQMADAKAAGINTAAVNPNGIDGGTSAATAGNAVPQGASSSAKAQDGDDLLQAAMAYLASNHTKEYYAIIRAVANLQANNAIKQLKGAAKQ